MQCRADFGDGGEGGFVGTGETAEGDVDAVVLGFDDFITVNPRGDETGGDAGLGLAVGDVFAVDGEVERIPVVGLTVDFDWVGGEHGFGVG